MTAKSQSREGLTIATMLFPGLVLLAGLVGTILWWVYAQRAADTKIGEELQQHTMRVADSLDARMRAYEQVLWGVSAMIAKDPDLTRRQWHDFAGRLELGKRYPGILAMGYARRLRPDQLASHIRQVRAEGFANFSVRPMGDRAEYSSIVYLEPFNERNRMAFGYDMLSEHHRNATMWKAARSGEAALSPVVKLVIDTSSNRASGQLLVVPVYRGGATPKLEAERLDKVIGWTYVAYSAEELIEQVIGPARSPLLLAFYDVDGELRTPIHDFRPNGESIVDSHMSGYNHATRVRVGGRTWEIQVHAPPRFVQSIEGDALPLLWVCAVASWLLAWLVFSQGRTRDRAMQLAKSMTVEMQRTQGFLTTIMNAIPEPVYVKDAQGRYVMVNNAFCNLMRPGLERNEIVGRHACAFFSQPDAELHAARDEEAFARTEPITYEFDARRANGELWYVRIVKQAFEVQGHKYVVGINADITKSRRAAAEAQRAKQFLELMIDALPEPIVIKDEPGRYLLVNQAWCETVGMPRDRVLGKTAGEIFPLDYARILEDQDQAVLKSGTRINQEQPRFNVEGKKGWVLKSKTVVQLDDGTRYHVQLTTDITEQRQALLAAEQSQRLLSAIINAVPNPLFVKDRDHRMILQNTAAARIAGHPEGALIGKTDRDFHPPALAEEFWAQDEQVFNSQSPFYYDDVRVMPDGSTTHWMKSKCAARLPDGSVYLVGLLTEITDLKNIESALRESEERFRGLAHLSSDWFWEQDADFRFVEMAGGANKDRVQKETGSLGKQRWELAPGPRHDPRWERHRATLEGHLPFHDFIYEVPLRDGDPLVISISGQPVFDDQGSFMGYRGVGRDITQEIKTQEELRTHRDHLQTLVHERTKELLLAKDAAEAADRAKTEFLANMSHELRTPMHAILSFAKLGRGKVTEGPLAPEKLGHYFQRIDQSAERLLLLLNALLDLSKLEAGAMTYDIAPSDLRHTISTVVDEFAALAREKGITLRTLFETRECQAWYDSVRIEQVLRNLLSNAMKFTPSGKHVTLSLRDTLLPGGRRKDDAAVVEGLEVRITDEGIGIPEGELSVIFDKFVQSSKTRSGAGGTGLGLAITREIIRGHGGSIEAAHNPQGGAIFIFTLRKQPFDQMAFAQESTGEQVSS